VAPAAVGRAAPARQSVMTSANGSAAAEALAALAAEALMMDAAYYSDGLNLRFFGDGFDGGKAVTPVMLSCPAKKIQARLSLLVVPRALRLLSAPASACGSEHFPSIISPCKCGIQISLRRLPARCRGDDSRAMPSHAAVSLLALIRCCCGCACVLVVAVQVMPYAMAEDATDRRLCVCDLRVDSPLRDRRVSTWRRRRLSH
jgi:hypothetical protein